MKVEKMLRKYNTHIIFMGLILAAVALYIYSVNKGLSEKHTSLSPLYLEPSANDINSCYTSINDVDVTSFPQSSTPIIDPVELLPQDTNSKWAELNPTQSNNTGAANFLNAPQNNMVSSEPSRNANLQLRTDPVIQQSMVCPWNMSTIKPTKTNSVLEIGQR